MRQFKEVPDFAWDPVALDRFYERAFATSVEPQARPELKRVVCSSDAVLTLPELIAALAPRPGAGVVIVQDATPMRRGQQDLKALVKELLVGNGWKTRVLVLRTQDGTPLSTTGELIGQVRRSIGPEEVVVALGSGCITDIVKHACHEAEDPEGRRIPLVAVQTANSVCAFTSRMAVLTVNGVKRTVPSRLPDALVIDTQILRDAPPHFRTGGLGDISVAAVTFADLRLADRLGMGRWSYTAHDCTSDIRDILLGGHPSIADQGEVGQGVAGKLLSIAGLALTVSGETAPLSGYEHVVSHMLDMSARRSHRPVANHGHQCALATILSLLLYRHVLASLDPARIDVAKCYPCPEEMTERVSRAFADIDDTGEAAAECGRDYARKLARWVASRLKFERLLANWEEEKAGIAAHLMSPGAFVALLRSFGHPMRFDALDVPVSRAEAFWAFHNAHLMRDRFSIGDLAHLCGLFDSATARALFDEFERLTGDAAAPQRGS